MGRYQTCIDLHIILCNQHGDVLLGERRNTGWADGQLGLPSGHLENGESATAGAAREADEEIGILIKTDDLRLIHVMHHHTNSGRLALFFEAQTWSGEVTNREPDKCTAWTFGDPAQLPNNVVPYVADALRHYAAGTVYAERGWA
ncbi:MAG TPA: NUDIX domain-containing protein [Pseudonocardiaceae bacterium]|jgi:8-oxo-dGTP pyrophosphatase MutT (NUDIX family)|nr:NUDIX domain-containing protein [Pseudonocardiaceae bacterium]